MAAPAEETAGATARRMHVHDLYRRCMVEGVMRDGHRGFIDHFRRHWVIRINETGRLECKCTDVETNKSLEVDALTVSTEALRTYVPDLKRHRDFRDAAPFPDGGEGVVVAMSHRRLLRTRGYSFRTTCSARYTRA